MYSYSASGHVRQNGIAYEVLDQDDGHPCIKGGVAAYS
jgi:hypothetical protein